jgi:hypothetical protein
VGDRVGAAAAADAVGATRQYSGTVGGVALCQVAVTVTYATGRGHALIGRALYLPEGCAADEGHRELAWVRTGGRSRKRVGETAYLPEELGAGRPGHGHGPLDVGLADQRQPAAYKKYGPVPRAL